MLFSIALILLCGFALSGIFNKLKLPGLLGMIITGVVLGPYVLNLISPSILEMSTDLREVALIIILTRAGLALELRDLKRVGRPALLMCFVPASFEFLLVTLLAPLLLGVSYLDAAIMGAIVGASSPAIIVPRMLKLMESGYGKKHSIPQIVMAGAAADDVYAIVLFTAFMGMSLGHGFETSSLFHVPVSIIVGLGVGILTGLLLVWVFKKIHMRDTIKILIILSTAFIIMTAETAVSRFLPMSGLLAVMAIGLTVLKFYDILAKRLSGKFSKIWVGAEIILFVLVGAAVDIRYVAGAGLAVSVLILCAIVFRMFGVFVCLIKTKLTKKEIEQRYCLK